MSELKISSVKRSKEQARASYDRLSRWYDLLAGNSERRSRETGLQLLNVRQGETVLEIGSGTGHAILALAQAVGHAGKVYGIDISQGMLDITQARVDKARLSERVILRRGDAVTLQFDANFFDAIFMCFTLELFDTPEIPTVLGECHRVLHKGGRLCVVALAKSQQPALAERMYEWAHRSLPTYADCRPIYLRQMLGKSRFQIVDALKLSMWGLPVAIALAQTQQSANRTF